MGTIADDALLALEVFRHENAGEAVPYDFLKRMGQVVPIGSRSWKSLHEWAYQKLQIYIVQTDQLVQALFRQQNYLEERIANLEEENRNSENRFDWNH
jgi:hypothetical protein